MASNRITRTHLAAVIARMNRAVFGEAPDAPTDAYNRTGSYHVVGAFELSGAYGGWQIQRVANESGAVSSVTTGYRPAREVLDLAHAWLDGWSARDQRDQGKMDSQLAGRN